MKCTILFLVLSMVVLMAEPGEAIVAHIPFHGNKAMPFGPFRHHRYQRDRIRRGEQQLEQEVHQELQQLEQLQKQENLNQRFNRDQLKKERVAFN
ncbi:moronecidin-like [Oreochromis aureus]|uniref:moronecidin-like n=1 Tax=Oreochromis aureus TaxID=47969 RepID=UPI001953EDEC|nr:moronecidin-like [Oreochromis aureus]